MRMNLSNTKRNASAFSSILIFAGLPLVLSGQLSWGGLSICLALAIIASDCINGSDNLQKSFENLSPEDVISELEHIATSAGSNQAESNNSPSMDIAKDKFCIKLYVEGLAVLARKYNKSNNKESLSLRYQQLGFMLIRLHPKNVEVVAGSISLLALIAKETGVRKRYKYQTEKYGLNQPISVLRMILERAKEEEDEKKEALLAESLQKGCLFMGAICNDGDDLGLQSLIVSEGGMKLILEASDWFRLHEDLSGWALWAIFILSYDRSHIKAELIRLQGIQVICMLMENNPTSLEVNRHGTALLFDLMRENLNEDAVLWNHWEIRKVAIASGLHDRIVSAINEFSDSMDIVTMGREILVGTGYHGNIPYGT